MGSILIVLKKADEVIDKIYDEHEAQMKAKDEEIRRLNNLYADTIKELGDTLMEIERLKAVIKIYSSGIDEVLKDNT